MRPKNTPFTIVMVVFIIAFVIVPLFRKNTLSRPGASQKIIDRLTAYRADHENSPEELLYSLLRNHQITFVGEPGKYHETTVFVTDLLPGIGGAGVSCLAVNFLNYEDQESIDRLISTEGFDESLARELLFRNLVMNGYREYLDMMRKVWEINRKAAPENRLRLIGLSPKQNWSVIQTGEDSEDPAVIHRVYAAGVPDTFMAEVIKKEIIEPGYKGLVYTGFQNALSTVQVESYQENMRENGFPDDTQRAAWLIKQMAGVESCTLFIHAPWTVKNSKYGVDYPLGGVLDSFMEKYDGPDRSYGFLTAGTPFGELPSAPGSLGMKDSRKLAELCDAYVLLGPIGDYTPFTAIGGFINGENFPKATENFPGPKETMARTPEELNEFIAGTAANMTNILEKFKK